MADYRTRIDDQGTGSVRFELYQLQRKWHGSPAPVHLAKGTQAAGASTTIHVHAPTPSPRASCASCPTAARRCSRPARCTSSWPAWTAHRMRTGEGLVFVFSGIGAVWLTPTMRLG